MASVSSLLSPSSSSSGSSTATPNAFSELNSEQFVKIMFTELTKQDPLKPSDSNALLNQMSSLRSIQSNIELTDKLSSLVTSNEFASAAGTIGTYVSGLNESSARVQGLVVSVSRTKDGAILNLDSGQRVPFKWLDEVIKLPDSTGGGSNNGNGSGSGSNNSGGTGGASGGGGGTPGSGPNTSGGATGSTSGNAGAGSGTPQGGPG